LAHVVQFALEPKLIALLGESNQTSGIQETERVLLAKYLMSALKPPFSTSHCGRIKIIVK
jgi:hypothetical protein